MATTEDDRVRPIDPRFVGIVRPCLGPFAGECVKIAEIDEDYAEVIYTDAREGGIHTSRVARWMVDRWHVRTDTRADQRLAFVLNALPPAFRENLLALILQTCEDAAEAWADFDPQVSETLRHVAEFGGAALRNDP